VSTRYLTNMLAALAAGFIVVISQAFTAEALGWVAFAIAIGVVAMTALAQLDRSRGAMQRMLDVGMVALGGLLMAFSVASSGSATIWLSFAFALGIVGVAVAGLTVHEVASWRAHNRLADLHWLHVPSAIAAHQESQAA
jgi:hypothetical protein